MASSAPQEILSLIAHHLAQLDKRLSPYALVNKSWQAAFERQIYSSIVVRSPSDVTTVEVNENSWTAPGGPHDKKGLPLETFINITSGPRDWQPARRMYVRQILYRVAVPYWLDEARRKDDDYTYDNVCRRENNQAFSEGVFQLFQHLSTWTNQTISLQIALQAEDASTDEEDGEPKSIPTYDDEEMIAPYRAEFVPGCSLPRAFCITSLEFLEFQTPETIWYEPCALDVPCYENLISLPARLSIASACSALKVIRLKHGDDVPSTEPNMRATRRTATAKGFSELPRTIKDMTLCSSSPLQSEIADFRQPNESAEQDSLCTVLQKFTMQLQHLRMNSLQDSLELFCPYGLALPLEAHWPYLETLHLKVCGRSFGYRIRYAKGQSIEQCLDDLYTSLGHAAQKMPRLKSLVLTFDSHNEFELSVKNERWNLMLCVMDNYQPSPGFLKAWKAPGGSLQPCINRHWREATFSFWPPS
ncbi:hypothetical protein KCU99_g9474, partial [Aureobasidium melanogenum]